MVVEVASATGWSRASLLALTFEELLQWREAAVEVSSRNAG